MSLAQAGLPVPFNCRGFPVVCLFLLQMGQAQFHFDYLGDKNAPRVQLWRQVGGYRELRLLLQRFLHGLGNDQVEGAGVSIGAGVGLYRAHLVCGQVQGA